MTLYDCVSDRAYTEWSSEERRPDHLSEWCVVQQHDKREGPHNPHSVQN